MIIKSLLDLDLYCLSCSYAVMKNYPEAEGTWKFIDRGGVKFTPDFVRDLKMELGALKGLKLTPEEFTWCVTNIPYIPKFYWQWLLTFRYNLDNFQITYDEKQGTLDIEITGNMVELFLYDVTLLAIMSELWARHKGGVLNHGKFISEVIDPDIELSNSEALRFSEFGTRRRYSFALQDRVVAEMKEKARYFLGTSNVYLAMKYGVKPIGTMSHAIRQLSNAFYGYRHGEYMANEAWNAAYHGNLGILLTDTISSEVFFRNLCREHALLSSGFRQDSGDEYKYIEIFYNRYKALGLDSKTKDLVFSNALTMQSYSPIHRAAKEVCRESGAGIGGHFVNTPEFKPNFVAKLIRARMTPREEWIDTIKLSDDPGKAMGSKKEIYIARITLGLEPWRDPEELVAEKEGSLEGNVKEILRKLDLITPHKQEEEALDVKTFEQNVLKAREKVEEEEELIYLKYLDLEETNPREGNYEDLSDAHKELVEQIKDILSKEMTPEEVKMFSSIDIEITQPLTIDRFFGSHTDQQILRLLEMDPKKLDRLGNRFSFKLVGVDEDGKLVLRVRQITYKEPDKSLNVDFSRRLPALQETILESYADIVNSILTLREENGTERKD